MSATAEVDRRLQPRTDLLRPRGRRADREEGRGRPRDRARPARLPPRRHLDRERDLGRGPCCRGGGTVDETARDGSRYRLRLVAHQAVRVRPLLQRDREPGALVRAARALGAASTTPTGTSGRPGTRAMSRSTRPLPAPSSRSSSASPRPRSSSTTTTSTSRLRSSAPGGRTPRWRTSRTSPGSVPTGGRCCRSRSSARFTRGCSRATSPAFTPSAGGARSSTPAAASGSTPTSSV